MVVAGGEVVVGGVVGFGVVVANGVVGFGVVVASGVVGLAVVVTDGVVTVVVTVVCGVVGFGVVVTGGVVDFGVVVASGVVGSGVVVADVVCDAVVSVVEVADVSVGGAVATEGGVVSVGWVVCAVVGGTVCDAVVAGVVVTVVEAAVVGSVVGKVVCVAGGSVATLIPVTGAEVSENAQAPSKRLAATAITGLKKLRDLTRGTLLSMRIFRLLAQLFLQQFGVGGESDRLGLDDRAVFTEGKEACIHRDHALGCTGGDQRIELVDL